MYTKVLLLTIVAAVAYAQHHEHEHGHAYSSQSIVRHEQPHHDSHGHQQESGHQAHHVVTLQHAAPVHHAPVHHAPVHHAPVQHVAADSHHGHHEDYYAYPKYQFEYKVEDPHTGDNKYQHESRDGDVVKGVYSLHDADGSIRTVDYSSDKHSGFNAFVKHSEPHKHVQPAHHYHH